LLHAFIPHIRFKFCYSMVRCQCQ